MNEETINKLVKDYKSGIYLKNLNKKYGIPKSTIYYNLSKLKIINRQNRVKELKNNNELLIGTFVGLWAGDGSKFIDRNKYTIKIHFHKDNYNFEKITKDLIKHLFGINSRLYKDGGNSASIKIFSKFIFYFLEDYLAFKRNKTLTIGLKENLIYYKKEFLKGFLLGLALSDGSLSGNRFTYATISKKLSKNVEELLTYFNYKSTKIYTHKREKYGWHDLDLIRINKMESKELEYNLDLFLSEMGYDKNFQKFK